jgi:hypothetical protein
LFGALPYDKNVPPADHPFAAGGTFVKGFGWGQGAEPGLLLGGSKAYRFRLIEGAGVDLVAAERDHPHVRLAARRPDQRQRALVGRDVELGAAQRAEVLAVPQHHRTIMYRIGRPVHPFAEKPGGRAKSRDESTSAED